jgi:arylsulfatase A-like enzyme
MKLPRILFTILALFGGHAIAAESPNVLLILADDLGWSDLGCQGSTFYETPHLDSLARRGVRFTQAYATGCVCSPTRGSLMTGRYPPRTGVTDLIPGSPNGKLIRAPNAPHLALEEVTLAEAFREAGYETFFAGKWHLGERGHSPAEQGFPVELSQVMDGKKQTNFFFPKSASPIVATEDDPKFSDRIADEAVRFLQSRSPKPFFAYLPFLAPHRPVKARADLVAKYEKKARTAPPDSWGKERGNQVRLVQNHAAYAAMIEQMDSAIGRILTALRQNQLEEKTIIVFTSDNGGLSLSSDRPTANLPLRAGKGWAYEGGLRVPGILVAPGVASPGSIQAAPITTTDWFPTLLDLTHQPLRPQLHLDGISLAPLLRGESLPARPIYWHYPHYGAQHGAPFAAIRSGDWKLIEWYEGPSLELFNLREDPGEKSNLAKKQPAHTEALHQQLIAWRQEVKAIMPTPNPDHPSKKPNARKPTR